MPNQYLESLHEISRRQLMLSHRIYTWYTYVRADNQSELTDTAARLALLEANMLLLAVKNRLDVDG